MRNREVDEGRRSLLINGLRFGGALAADTVLFNRKVLWTLPGSGRIDGNRGSAQAQAEPQETLPPIGPLKVPTAAQIEAYLPPGLNPEFRYPDERYRKGPPTYAAIGPLVIDRIIGDRLGNVTAKGDPADLQKYLELALPGDVEGTKFKLSFLSYKPTDKRPLQQFVESHSPDTQYRVVFPIYPPDEWRAKARKVYQNSLGQTPEEAARYDDDTLQRFDDTIFQSGTLSGYDGGWYWTTLDTGYLVPVAA